MSSPPCAPLDDLVKDEVAVTSTDTNTRETLPTNCVEELVVEDKNNVDTAYSHMQTNWPTSSSSVGVVKELTKRNLIVNYLPQNITDLELFNIFVPFGALESVRVMKDSKSGYSYGFGFVNFLLEEDAITAQVELNGFELENKKIKVSFAMPPSDDIKDTNLYITNLPRSITEDEVVEIFKPYGTIIQKKLLRDKYTNMPRGVAFIRYAKREEAAQAILGLKNYAPNGSSEAISIRLAQDHGKQKAVYLAGFQAGIATARPHSDNVGKWRQDKSRSRSKSLYSRR